MTGPWIVVAEMACPWTDWQECATATERATRPP
jgi:hypothetical protein